MKHQPVISALPLAVAIALVAAGNARGSSTTPGASSELAGNRAPVAHACSGCTEAQILNTATRLGRGTQYIYDLANNSIHNVNVECEPVRGSIRCLGSEEAVPAAIAGTFAGYRHAYAQNSSSETFFAQLKVDIVSLAGPGLSRLPIDDGYVNAYGTIILGSANNAVAGYLSTPSNYPGVTAWVNWIMSQVKNPFIDFAGQSIVVTAEFHDGSRRTYIFDKSIKMFVPVPNTAIDSHGNVLPESRSAGLRQFNFRGGSWDSHSYDRRNVIEFLTGEAAPSGTCITEIWDGKTVTCVMSH